MMVRCDTSYVGLACLFSLFFQLLTGCICTVVVAKGKGEMQTYWLQMSSKATQDAVGSNSAASDKRVGSKHDDDDKETRLIEWNVDILLRLLTQIVAQRRACPPPASEILAPNEAKFTTLKQSSTMDEVKEIITLPKFKGHAQPEDYEGISLDPVVVDQLRHFVATIASVYRDNAFHNFEHASHVSMSVVKLLSRIVAPQNNFTDATKAGSSKGKMDASRLHDHTYGITSDPLTQFSCVFSALIHDVDHSGVPNAQLVKEHTNLAVKYNDKSVAEQNSVDIAWAMLNTDTYKDLRKTIYETDGELKRFRQLVVNSVMATDIVDKELKMLRNLRWDRAFSQAAQILNTSDSVNRKATIVIEHLIQASDVAHTMQHWHIYRKWNERFFFECYQAYRDGRSDVNPADGWYEGELGFFDYYIIPLSKKLKDCGVFGVSSDEYYNYAVRNRQEWEARGREVVDEMVEHVGGKLRN
jgi:3'5'-cyclic nucleotide phosphodiesterase